MALSSSIYRADIDLSNLNTHQYENYNLTMAKHPSESESRMMFRLLAYLYCAHEDLAFTKGLSAQDEPEIWQKDFAGDIVQWIELGLPDLKRIRQASGKSKSVKIFTHHQSKSEDWWSKIKGSLIRNDKVEVYHLNLVEEFDLEDLVSKSMKLSCVIEDGVMHLSNDDLRIGIEVSKAGY